MIFQKLSKLFIFLFLTISIFQNVAQARDINDSGYEIISPEGVTFYVGLSWRGSWGGTRVTEYIFIQAMKNERPIEDMEMRFQVSGFGFGEGYQTKAALKKVEKFKKLVEKATKEKKKLWVTRSLRYDEWDGLSELPEDRVTAEEESLAGNSSHGESFIADDNRSDAPKYSDRGFNGLLFGNTASFQE